MSGVSEINHKATGKSASKINVNVMYVNKTGEPFEENIMKASPFDFVFKYMLVS